MFGRMGEAFAANLLAAGYRIIAYERDRRRAQPLQVEGARAGVRLGTIRRPVRMSASK
jgi:3-hydroxyisobutyrate dehydrogenase-like beta-hydroxyacid dehydrogenase